MSFNGWQCQDGPKFPQTHETHPMPKINGNEIRPGNILEHDGGLWGAVKGDLLGHAVRFDTAAEVLVAGEGIETVLSPRQVLPHMPMLAALSAAHLAAILFPPSLRRLYVLRDRDPAGDGARDSLASRAASFGIEAVTLTPVEGDFNDDLRRRGADALRAALKDQLHPEDIRRFMER